MSPSKHAQSLEEVRDLKTSKRRTVTSTQAFKRRRLQLKEFRQQSTACSEVCEGVTYSPGVDLLSSELSRTIPPPTHVPDTVPLASYADTEVFIDLETTGLGMEY